MKSLLSSRPLFARPLGLAATLATLGLLPAAEAVSLSGIVYEDTNRNAVHDAGEPGLPGLGVSDGTRIVRTDAAGRYTIEVGDDCTVFVLKPRGYAPPLSATGLPLFYHHHVPAGTRDTSYRFKGLAPTGPAPASLDFPLHRQEEPDTYHVLVTADPQPYDTTELQWHARTTVPELAAQHPAFALALGDLVGDNLQLHVPYTEANGVTGYPWYNVIGNHDTNYDAPDDHDADCSYRRVFGPASYAFAYGRAHFLILDNVEWLGKKLKPDGTLKRDNYRARLTPAQLQFVAAYLAAVPADDLVVVCTHIPMVHGLEAREPITPQFPQLLQLLSGHPHTLSLSGHMHYTYSAYFGAESGYHADGARHLHLSAPATSGNWYAGPLDQDGAPVSLQRDGTPRGYLWLDVSGHDYSIRYKALNRPADEQMRLYLPEVAEPATPLRLRVNFFVGNAAAQVACRLDGAAAWLPLTQEHGIDPGYVALRERVNTFAEAGGYRPMQEPVKTDHLWETTLPANLPVGMHRLEVRATDAYGHTFTQETTIRIVPSLKAWTDLDATGYRKRKP